MVEFDQRAAVIAAIGATIAGVFSGDAHQTHGFALQRSFHLMAQIRLRLIEAHAHFEPGLALGFGEQIDVRQVGQLQQNLGQRRRADALQIDRARDQFRLDADQGFTLEDHIENLMLITDFGERQRNRRAAVADALLAVDLLRLVQMAEGDITDAFAEQAGGQRFGIADDQAALGILRHRAPGHVRVADRDQRLPGLTLGIRRRDQPFMHLTDAAQIVVTQMCASDFRRAQERQRQTPRGDFSLRIRQRQQ